MYCLNSCLLIYPPCNAVWVLLFLFIKEPKNNESFVFKLKEVLFVSFTMKHLLPLSHLTGRVSLDSAEMRELQAGNDRDFPHNAHKVSVTDYVVACF